MQKPSERKSDFLSLIIFSIAVFFTLLCLSILVLRISSILRDSLYAQATGAEASPLYGIYKVWAAEPLYEPLSATATPMIYNYLFYYAYGYLAKIFVRDAQFLPVFSRILTLIVTLCFSAALLFYIRNKFEQCLTRETDYRRFAWVYLFPLVIFFAPFIGWWNLAARPDLFGMGLELCAIILLLKSKNNYDLRRTLAITFIFWLSWSFKQSLILVYLGFLAVLLIERKFIRLFASFIFFSLLCCLPLFWFGAPYVQNIIKVPAANPWQLSFALWVVMEALVVGSYIYLPLFFLLSRRIRKIYCANANLRILLIIFVITFIGAFIGAGRWAGARNHYFSAYLVANIFVLEYLVSSWGNGDGYQERTARYACLCLYSIALVLSSLYLILPNRFGNISLLTSSQRQAQKKMISVIKAAAKPVFVESNYLALPWLCGQGRPDIVDDSTYIYSGSGIVERRIKNRYYAEAFLFEESRWKDLFTESDYKPVAGLSGFIRLERAQTP